MKLISLVLVVYCSFHVSGQIVIDAFVDGDVELLGNGESPFDTQLGTMIGGSRAVYSPDPYSTFTVSDGQLNMTLQKNESWSIIYAPVDPLPDMFEVCATGEPEVVIEYAEASHCHELYLDLHYPIGMGATEIDYSALYGDLELCSNTGDAVPDTVRFSFIDDVDASNSAVNRIILTVESGENSLVAIWNSISVCCCELDCDDVDTCCSCPVDENECTDGSHNCHEFADCVYAEQTFTCNCQHGYEGDGTTIGTGCAPDECTLNTHDCHEFADCMDSADSYTCDCHHGYDGDGLTTGTGCVKGDPHFTGFNGGKYDFPGNAGTVYNIISDEHFQLNSRFIEPIHSETQCKGNELEVLTSTFFECEDNCFQDEQCGAYTWSPGTQECTKVDGFAGKRQAENEYCGVFDLPATHSFMGDLGILLGQHNITIHVGIDTPSVVFLDGQLLSEDVSLLDVPATLKFERLKTHRHAPQVAHYMLSLPKYKIDIAQKKFHFNIEVEYIPAGTSLPHGALGQSARWEKECISEAKSSNKCIEGDYPNYEIQSGDLLGTKFRWNQYIG